MKEVLTENKGSVVQWIIILAVIAVIVVLTMPKLQFKVAEVVKYDVEENIDYALGYATAPTPDTVSPDDYLIGREVRGMFDGIKVKTSPSNTPYIYNVNSELKLSAEPIVGDGYRLRRPLKCTWENYPGYSGNDCEGPLVPFPPGDHDISVKLCDRNGACELGTKRINVDYRDPLLVMHEEWDNYIKSGGASGDWRYDDATKTIYSTKNVGWTGFYNPNDNLLENYTLRFQMTVTPSVTDDDVIGMTFRMQDLSNMYLLSVDARDSNGGVGGYHSGLYKIRNGTKTQLIDLMPLKWERDVYMNVEIKVQGPTITLRINGSTYSVVDTSSPHLKGSYGPFTNSQANGRFKDLQVDIH